MFLTFIYVVHNFHGGDLEAVGGILLILVSVEGPTFLGYYGRIRSLIDAKPCHLPFAAFHLGTS